ncbi:hypothetical protein GCK72_024345 [Caenorhabditis remanei]|uniref:3-beta hydroxysteroid dehydrogenase/isomerase domain-containing protein n=1 Tax=Caenorhabditis remanei TaxID=31234 RepID=A0A6A5FZX4_CAERE|nr:hypothetical protein GCK72_024345 [Caenorhabditis remanei]KAF1747879.1 hypothetical protein GCK72_024345 [Caenorhabditis remanei]
MISAKKLTKKLSKKKQMGHFVIIGGGGYLGANIIHRLQKHGCENKIIVVDPYPRAFQTISINRDNVTFIKKSFLDSSLLDVVLKNAEAVFHLAAVGHTGLIAGNKDYVFDFNVNGTKMLVHKCQEHGVSRFLYASSVAVSFIGQPLNNVSEDEPLPSAEKYLDYYSASKAEAEIFVLSQSTPKFKTTALRFRGIYGPEDPNVTHKVATLIKNGLFVGKVSVHGRESKSNASSGANCGQAFELADKMLQKPDGLHGRAYYIMDEEETGQYQFWTPLVLALGKTPPSRFIPYELMRVVVPQFEHLCYGLLKTAPLLTKFELSILATDNTYDISRARNELGYKPEPSLMSEVAKYYQTLEEQSIVSSFTTWRLIVTSMCILFFSIAVLYLIPLI